LDQHPGVALSFVNYRFIDTNGEVLPVQTTGDGVERRVSGLDTGQSSGLEPVKGRISGLEYLHRIVSGDNWEIWPSAFMLRASALAEVGSFDVLHQRHAIEHSLYFRLAARFDFFYIPKALAYIRLHSTQQHIQSINTGPLGMVADRMDAIAYLLQTERADEPSYRLWLAGRLLDLGKLRSEYTSQLIPTLTLSNTERLELAQIELRELIPAEKCMILVDQASLGANPIRGRRTIPFLERGGGYWGPPPNDQTAIQELERMRCSGASFFVFAWPAFWWLDYYAGLRDYLTTNYRCILENSRLLVFDLHKR
jgi:hypothetical protein